MAVTICLLGAGDEPAFEAFLGPRADSSMFLRANARQAGLVYQGRRLQGTYVAAFEGEAIVGVAAHAWNGVVLVQSPIEHLAAVVRAAVERSGRPVTGLSGPFAQMVAARAALGFEHAPASFDSRDDLFALALSDLRVPGPLADGSWLCRPPRSGEIALLSKWRAAYSVELLGATPGPELDERARAEMETADGWLLTVDERPCAYSGFNARLPDVVQIGGVYVPPELRRRGYARAAVAGSLLAARAAGVTRALLFTGAGNLAARTAYLALGFRVVGDYGLVLLAPA